MDIFIIKRGNLKLATLILFGLLSLFLITVITADLRSHQSQTFLKKDSSYVDFFQEYFKGASIINAWEKDITEDKKPEFVFLTKKDCAECQKLFSIFQGERKVFEAPVDKEKILLQDNGFLIKNGQDKFYQWLNSRFQIVKDTI